MCRENYGKTLWRSALFPADFFQEKQSSNYSLLLLYDNLSRNKAKKIYNRLTGTKPSTEVKKRDIKKKRLNSTSTKNKAF